MSLLLSRLTFCSFSAYAATQAEPVSRDASVWMLRKPDKYIVSFRFIHVGEATVDLTLPKTWCASIMLIFYFAREFFAYDKK
ncbi:MAG: hypothetical protein B6D76_18585 [gamma proteobacterium symbiont of Stewartia floridana]|nr:MAG: hypothetical protein B6D76_18585 [gamma proteobacterium symbiont of Stewartia floridana]RLW57057.1 MAG: hypothetical protein B6D75_18880 [gamma proteobacterium symbiont of Stewartia floridana]